MAQRAPLEPPAPAAADEVAPRDPDNLVILRGATWADFERVLDMRGETSSPRFAYLEGALEIMSPSRSHEVLKSVIGCLVEVWCLERGVDVSPIGAWTLKDEAAERGLEPDECYVVGDDSDDERDRPDLAIEVDWSRRGLDKLEIYRKLRVREVWRWRSGKLALFALRGERYEPIASSEVLVGLDVDQLLEFVEMRPTTRAMRAYRAALQAST